MKPGIVKKAKPCPIVSCKPRGKQRYQFLLLKFKVAHIKNFSGRSRRFVNRFREVVDEFCESRTIELTLIFHLTHDNRGLQSIAFIGGKAEIEGKCVGLCHCR